MVWILPIYWQISIGRSLLVLESVSVLATALNALVAYSYRLRSINHGWAPSMYWLNSTGKGFLGLNFLSILALKLNTLRTNRHIAHTVGSYTCRWSRPASPGVLILHRAMLLIRGLVSLLLRGLWKWASIVRRWPRRILIRILPGLKPVSVFATVLSDLGTYRHIVRTLR